MKCRHCGRKLPEGTTYCSRCKKNNFAKWQIIVGIVGAVVLMAALAVVLIVGLDLDFLKTKPDTTVTTPAYVGQYFYGGTDEEVTAAEDDVVATVNGAQLTNRILQFYYNWEINNFVSANYSYLSMMGFDYTMPLADQKCYYEDISWQEYFVQAAIETWRNYQLVYALAMEEGFVLSEDTQATLESLPDDLKEAAAQYNYDDTDAWLRDYMSANITVADYVEYSTLMAYYSEYVTVEPTDAALEQYYADNEDYFIENEVGKDAAPATSVRHILIQPADADGDGTSTDEEWTAAEKRAKQILQEWKSGKATEASFAAMAKLYSADTGSTENGGLYTGITESSNYVEPFLNWSISGSRRVGDTGIVKTEYGYHIMYFSGTEPVWVTYAKQWYAQDRELDLIDQGNEKWPDDTNHEAICIHEFDLIG